ncbi:hypothetical protein N7470_004957 [Penicillium chermesinum]|nr:hypothetical protein N7470_004957 [Penicillium chermesinum]
MGSLMPQMHLNVGPASGVANFGIEFLFNLQRLGIDTHAIYVASYVGSQLRLGPTGHHSLLRALHESELHKTASKTLWFGLGQRTPIGLLTSHEACSHFVALTGCLLEIYSPWVTTRIMRAFCEQFVQRAPAGFGLRVPGELSMQKLVEKCGGLVSTTAFPLLAEKFMSFDGESTVGRQTWPKLDSSDHIRSLRKISDPQSIAEALYAMTGLAKREERNIRNITLVGTADGAALAAIGAWLFDLSVTIYNKSDNRRRYSNFDERKQQAQLTAVLAQAHQTRLFLSLKQSPEIFGTVVGSGARIFSGIANGERGVPMEWTRECTIHFENSYGINYVTFLQRRFPELGYKGFHRSMLNAASIQSFKEATDTFENAVGLLCKKCACKLCSKESGARKHSPYCLAVLTLTVLRFGRPLAGINPIAALYPQRGGLEYLYGIQRQRFCQIVRGNKPMPFFMSVIETEYRFLELSVMQVARCLFSRPIQSPKDDPMRFSSAIDEDGICYYLEILRDPYHNNVVNYARVNVLNGHILYEGRYYRYIDEPVRSHWDIHRREKTEGSMQNISRRAVEDIQRCYGSTPELQLTVRTSNKVLEEFLQVSIALVRGSTVLSHVGPRFVVDSIAHGMGRAACRRDGCKSSADLKKEITKELAKARQQQPVCTINIRGHEVAIVNGDQGSTLMALYGLYNPLVARQECLACCIESGCSIPGWKKFPVILAQPASRNGLVLLK